MGKNVAKNLSEDPQKEFETSMKLEEVETKKKEPMRCNKQREANESKQVKEEGQKLPDLNSTLQAFTVESLQKELTMIAEDISKLKLSIMQLQEGMSKYQSKLEELSDNNILTKTTVMSIHDNIIKQNSFISVENKRLTKVNIDMQERLDNKQERLEQIIQTCQEDRYRKDKIKLINKYIYQIDLIRKTLYDFNINRNCESNNEAVVFLESQLKEVIKGMEATLFQEMVEKIQLGEKGAIVNPDIQETIDTVATDNPELDGKIYCSISPGYIWTLPYILKAKMTDTGNEIKTYRFLIRPEQIITYKFNK